MTLVMTTRSPGLAAKPCSITSDATCWLSGVILPFFSSRPRSPRGKTVRTKTRSAGRSRITARRVCGVILSDEAGELVSPARRETGSRIAVASRTDNARFMGAPIEAIICRFRDTALERRSGGIPMLGCWSQCHGQLLPGRPARSGCASAPTGSFQTSRIPMRNTSVPLAAASMPYSAAGQPFRAEGVGVDPQIEDAISADRQAEAKAQRGIPAEMNAPWQPQRAGAKVGDGE